MARAEKAGLDLARVSELFAGSFAASEVWRMRAPMMVAGDYTTSRGTYGVVRKDAAIIEDLAAGVGASLPVFRAALKVHRAGQSAGYGGQDTASLFEVYRGLATPSSEPEG
jgi:3-hydroxyisobutyrate dehydrogenase-like beta-hydroxyacid dehydrogenase